MKVSVFYSELNFEQIVEQPVYTVSTVNTLLWKFAQWKNYSDWFVSTVTRSFGSLVKTGMFSVFLSPGLFRIGLRRDVIIFRVFVKMTIQLELTQS